MNRIEKVYYNPSNPSSFGGIQKLKRGVYLSKRQEDEFKAGSDTYNLHKNRRYKFKRNRYFTWGPADLIQLDLVDMSSLYEFNKPYKYLLTAIDAFTRKANAVPLKNKTASEVRDGIKIIFKRFGYMPINCQTDLGSEFHNSIVKAYFKSQNINFYSTHNEDIKCSLLERWHRTIRGSMWRYFTFKRTYKYTDVLQKLITSYNNTYHRTIKMAPNEINADNYMDVWGTLYADVPPVFINENPNYKFKIGDHIRLANKHEVFDRGFKRNWGHEVFIIHSRKARVPPVYEIKDLNNEVIKGTFYAPEIQKVTLPKEFLIEKIIQRKKNKCLVKYQGYPASFNQWISCDSVRVL